MLFKSREIEKYVKDQTERGIMCASQNNVSLVYYSDTKKYAVIYKEEVIVDSMDVTWITEQFNIESNSAYAFNNY